MNLSTEEREPQHKSREFDKVPEHLISELLQHVWQSEQVDALISEGARLLSKGLPILAVNGKTPCDRTGNGRQRWQTSKLDENKLRRGLQGAYDRAPRLMNKRKKETVITYKTSDPAIGLRMGPDSCIDIETDSASEERAVAYLFRDCEILPTPTFASKRGLHQLFKFDNRLAVIGLDVFEFKTPDGDSVKIRLGAGSGGAHSVIPPSIYYYEEDSELKVGARTWLPFLSLEELDYTFASLPEVVVNRLLQYWQTTNVGNVDRSNADSCLPSIPSKAEPLEGYGSSSHTHSPPTVCVPPLKTDTEDCYRRSLPTALRERHDGNFKFCRLLKCLPEFYSLDPETEEGSEVLQPLAVEWYQRAKRFIVNATVEDHWRDFCEQWRRAKPYSRVNLEMAYLQSQTEKVSGSVLTVVARCHSPSIAPLVALCAVLQRMNNIEPFALDVRAVGDVLKVGKSTAARNIKELRDHGILEQTSPGDRKAHKAAEYIYLPAFERAQLAVA